MNVEMRPDRHRDEAADAEKPELVIHAGQLVVIADAQADLHRQGQRGLAAADARGDAELEVPSGLQATVSLVSARFSRQLERHEPIWLQRRRPERGAVVDRQLEPNFLYMREAVVGARV